MPHNVPNKAAAYSQGEAHVFVWDISVRLFHWTLVALIAGLFITAEIMDGTIELHATLGQVTIILVLFRLMWGFFGSSYARFTQFIHGPSTVISYARSLLGQKHEFIAGHNPLGGWMVLALLVTVLIQAVLGLFANDDIIFDGPLSYLVSKETSDLITGLHETIFNLLFLFVCLHVAAVIWHKLFKGEDLISPMFSGYKKLPPGADAENTHGGSIWLALVLLAISSGVVCWFTV